MTEYFGVQEGWNSWRRVSGVICDRRVPATVKGKVYRTVVKPAMMSGLETLAIGRRQEAELEVAEVKMLRFSLWGDKDGQDQKQGH